VCYANNLRVRSVPVRFLAARRGDESKRFAEFGHDKTKRSVRGGHAIRSPPLGKTTDVPRRDMRDTKASSGCRYRQCHGHGRTCRGVAGHRLLRRGVCRKSKFNWPLRGSPSGRPLIEAPNRAVLANSWNGYEGVLDHLFGVAIMVILVRVFPTGFFLSLHVGVQLTELTVGMFRVVQCSTTAGG
jgi:hypothetical protein